MPTTRSQAKLSDTSPNLNQAVHDPMIEWLDLDFSETSLIKSTNWRDCLNEIQAVEGCHSITFAYPLETPNRLWIIIQWLSETHRNRFLRTDLFAHNAKTTLYSDIVYFSYRVDYSIGKMISAGFPFSPDPRQIHELWMAYFPVYTLDAEKKRERWLPRLMNFYERDEESDPMAGIVSQDIAWLSGETNYQGVQCQRLVWFMEWKSKEAEELYKSTVRWVRETEGNGKSRKLQLTFDMFIEDLKSLGMVGYETWHAHFEDIRGALDSAR
ncbi:hypothetical protein F1880_003949 [Penicillium rolfsii]|nr:hypothetical protein F1880_003949 [Penicillium rolfsii]